jgi:hypothetical protein
MRYACAVNCCLTIQHVPQLNTLTFTVKNILHILVVSLPRALGPLTKTGLLSVHHALSNDKTRLGQGHLRCSEGH